MPFLLEHQVDRQEPLVERNMGIFDDRAHRDRKGFAASGAPP